MKKTIILMAIFMISLCSYAQDSYGIRTGVNISNLDFETTTTFNNGHRNGAFFGGFVNWKFTKKVSLLTEIQYSAAGAKARNLRINYLQLPVLLRLELARKLTLGVGPMVSLRTRSFQDSFRNTFENVTASGVAGLEYMITRKIFVDARFHYGLTNVIEGDLSEEFGEAKNTTIQFGVGIKI